MARKPKYSGFGGGSTRRMRGFERTSGLLSENLRKVGESRGFAVSRVLTHWSEIVGEEVAQQSRPVSVTYARSGFGATLTVLTTGAHGPMLQMQEPRLREKVNACYGYAAISHIRFTQTAPVGFAEGQVEFTPAPAKKPAEAKPEIVQAAQGMASDVQDDGLRQALADLATNVLTKTRR